jgi:thiamine biosynthesis lipoprotein
MSGTVATQNPSDEADALDVVHRWIVAFDRAANRFRPDSELSVINSGEGGTFELSPLLHRCFQSARRASDLTQALCDPTILNALEALGYDRDYDEMMREGALRRSTSAPAPGPMSWRVDPVENLLSVQPGVRFDLGASAKALFADIVLDEISSRGGALVEIGGDVALRGSGPEGPWVIGVATSLHISGQEPRISLADGALATSSRTTRSWSLENDTVNHIIDPRTGQCANGPYVVSTVAAADCVSANALSTAALLWNDDAPLHLVESGAAARLVREDGTIELVGGWTREESA